ncbi:unnamed protein product [Chrysodeixis includens]|uniref:Uncharacterized protein n=1 Tax=Chrysodeixis includens TaxID=689277 RepID=A0A9P0BMR7_CHRIL|nr:unnamed protein product [Chrysodeixis includens]
MTQKQVKFGRSKRWRKVIQVVEDYERSTEPRRVLLSCDDVERMAIESSRARLISHLVSKSNDHSVVFKSGGESEFTSYSHEPMTYPTSHPTSHPTSYDDPPHSPSPYANRVPVQEQVLSAYPSIVEQPWCPYAPSSTVSEIDLVVGHDYICKCGKCTTRNCPARSASKGRILKDNIMTFCDRYTMTQKVNDTGSGRTPTPSKPESYEDYFPDGRCPPSLVAVRGANGKLHLHEMYSRKGRPVPILKKCCNDPYYDYNSSSARETTNNYYDDEVLDVKPLGSRPTKYLVPERVLPDDIDIVSRINIYNEGISDRIANKFPMVPKKAPSPPDCSRTSSSTKCKSENNYIPYSHRSDSKYHTCCKKPHDKPYVGDEFSKKHPPAPNPKTVTKKPIPVFTKSCKRCKEPPRCIKLPKKVLTSEKVMDATDKHKERETCRRIRPSD